MKSACKIRFGLGSHVLGLATVAAGALALIPLGLAQDAGPAALAARLSDVQGQVQLAQGNQILASQAPVNAPLFEGTQISTSDDGRAEIQFEDGSVARIPPNSSLLLSVLRRQGNSTETEVVLQGGLGYFEMQGNTDATRMRVRFGNSVITTSGFTVVRVDVDNPPGDIAVFSGNAHVDDGNGQAVDMHGGESVSMNSAYPGNWALTESIEPDSWDAWNSDRDQALTAQEADRTTATNSQPDNSNPAWGDLDSNGNWYDVPGQGYVWSPYEAMNSGWDPYAYGSWMWTPGFGYGWVSSEPWGFMPYQMGMWNYYGGFGWGWMPGGPSCWGNGGWTANVGNAPLRYQPPMRPRGGPVGPGQRGPLLTGVTGGRYEPHPVVAVNRLRDSMRGTPARPRNTPATIAGSTVQPLRPLAPRAVYDHTYSSGFRQQQGTTAGARGAPKYGYTVSPATGYGNRPGVWNTQRPSVGSARQPVYNGNYGARPSAPFGGSFSRPSAPSHGSFGGGAPAGRVSGGWGGGGGHVGGGGGGAPHGGGGGAPHGGGGGGSHR